jgi:RimJ/RimL family protein N-acetyltransferase
VTPVDDTGIRLRRANIDDSELLLKWRNDPVTRRFSRNSAYIKREEHRNWISASLKNPNRQIYIAEKGGTPVGTVRADFDGHAYELSWTVAPGARGRNIGKKMVARLVNVLGGPVRAEVKKDNIASVKVARAVGLSVDREGEGFLYFSKNAPR